MSRFDQEWALVPTGARWTAALVALAFAALMAGIFLLPALAEQNMKALLILSPFFLLTLLGAVPIAIYVLLLGYVWGDARRRGMNHVMWTLLALFIPSAVGIILYFILRDPVPVRAPRAGRLPARDTPTARAAARPCGRRARTAGSRWSRLAQLRELRRRAHGSEPAAPRRRVDAASRGLRVHAVALRREDALEQRQGPGHATRTDAEVPDRLAFLPADGVGGVT